MSSYTMTHTHFVRLPWTSDRPVAEATTHSTHNKHQFPRARFETATPASEQPMGSAVLTLSRRYLLSKCHMVSHYTVNATGNIHRNNNASPPSKFIQITQTNVQIHFCPQAVGWFSQNSRSIHLCGQLHTNLPSTDEKCNKRQLKSHLHRSR